jgi:hypothetical protein
MSRKTETTYEYVIDEIDKENTLEQIIANRNYTSWKLVQVVGLKVIWVWKTTREKSNAF